MSLIWTFLTKALPRDRANTSGNVRKSFIYFTAGDEDSFHDHHKKTDEILVLYSRGKCSRRLSMTRMAKFCHGIIGDFGSPLSEPRTGVKARKKLELGPS